MKRILVGYDGSLTALRALDRACCLAKNVRQPPPRADGVGGPVRPRRPGAHPRSRRECRPPDRRAGSPPREAAGRSPRWRRGPTWKRPRTPSHWLQRRVTPGGRRSSRPGRPPGTIPRQHGQVRGRPRLLRRAGGPVSGILRGSAATAQYLVVSHHPAHNRRVRRSTVTFALAAFALLCSVVQTEQIERVREVYSDGSVVEFDRPDFDGIVPSQEVEPATDLHPM